MFEIPWITLTVFLPLIGAGVLAFVPGEHRDLHRYIAALFMGLTFLVSLPLMINFDPANGGYQLASAAENIAWIPAIGASYRVGIDGISLWLVMLTTFLGPIVVLSGFGAVEERVKEYHLCLLVLQTAMLGALVSLDLLLFYVFWELMLVPMYLLIGIWGGQNRIYAAVKLFLYTMVGSVLMLVGILYLYAKAGGSTFDIDTIISTGQALSFNEQRLLFAAFALAFLIKVPLFPFHTWLPDAHVQAPTAGSVILASILLKMGTYGLVRYAMPALPDAMYWAAPAIAILSVVGIVYGAVVAYVQKDVKKLVAYSSVSHLGFVTLGLFAMTSVSVTGALYQSLAHGISTGGLFLMIGILYERRHTRMLADFGGLTKSIPRYAVFFVIVAFASAGVPGLVGFVGEFMILLGSSASYALTLGDMAHPFGLAFGPDKMAFALVAVAATGVILGALYLLHVVQKMLFGPITDPKNAELSDLTPREIGYMLPVIAMCFVMGLFPQPFLSRMEASVTRLIGTIENGANGYGPVVEANQDREATYRDWLHRSAATQPWAIQAELGSAGAHGGHGGGHGDAAGHDGHDGAEGAPHDPHAPGDEAPSHH
ncbi:MAG: NADH-quinone oxidoreductase subunit M [Myxococcales bacterium]|nr:NADH-quinone oxidoreductase subunit M [Myxococcales bacterium]